VIKRTCTRPRRPGPALAACVLLAAACGRTDGPKPYPVKGVLRVNGQPAAGATVAFYSTTPFEKTIIPVGVTEADGSFTLTTYKPRDGAPAGDYAVAVTWPESRSGWKVGEDRLSRAFADPKTSGLQAHVEAKGNNDLPPFELKASVKPPPNANLPRRGKNREH
jgi:hypothetical protein